MLYPLSYEGGPADRSRSAGGPGRRGRLRPIWQRARGSRWFRGWLVSTVLLGLAQLGNPSSVRTYGACAALLVAVVGSSVSGGHRGATMLCGARGPRTAPPSTRPARRGR